MLLRRSVLSWCGEPMEEKETDIYIGGKELCVFVYILYTYTRIRLEMENYASIWIAFFLGII